MEKMTYVAMLTDVKNGVALTEEHIQKIDALIARLSKPRAKSDKPTKAQREKAEQTQALAEMILPMMESGVTYQASELAEMVNTSTSKMVQVLKALGDAVVKSEESRKGKGKVTVYSVADADAVDLEDIEEAE